MQKARRRLTIVSDSSLVEGCGGGACVGPSLGGQGEVGCVAAFGGISRKGYSPYHPKKRNQDSLLLEEHKPTGSLVVGVFDGHGEAGDLVSGWFADRLLRALAENPRFAAADPTAALVEELARAEAQLLKSARPPARPPARPLAAPPARPRARPPARPPARPHTSRPAPAPPRGRRPHH